MQHEFCVNIASAVQLTTRHHHLRHSEVVAWFEAMDHTCMRNAQMFGSGPIESSVVVDNHEYKKPQMTHVFGTYVFLKTAKKKKKSYKTDSGNEIKA